jgi:hypothetical protein
VVRELAGLKEAKDGRSAPKEVKGDVPKSAAEERRNSKPRRKGRAKCDLPRADGALVRQMSIWVSPSAGKTLAGGGTQAKKSFARGAPDRDKANSVRAADHSGAQGKDGSRNNPDVVVLQIANRVLGFFWTYRGIALEFDRVQRRSYAHFCRWMKRTRARTPASKPYSARVSDRILPKPRLEYVLQFSTRNTTSTSAANAA